MSEVPLHDGAGFKAALEDLYSMGARPVAFFAVPAKPEGREEVTGSDCAGLHGSGFFLAAAFAVDEIGKICLLGRRIVGESSFESLTPAHPSLHMFEREFWEETGVEPIGHPWLKPVRYPGTAQSRRKALDSFMEQRGASGTRSGRAHGHGEAEKQGRHGMPSHNRGMAFEGHPFLSMTGPESHEVAVGPVHAGVIEPGHFRFLCYGERVYHLEIQLGFQHRAAEKLLSSTGFSSRLIRVAESLAGDTVIGHSLACCSVLETLAGAKISSRAKKIRALALELERIAMHIGDLGALANDIAYMMGSSVFGAIRTLVINSTLGICGSRFGRGLLRFGGVNFDLSSTLAGQIDRTLAKCEEDVDLIAGTMLDSPGVLSRFENTGSVPADDAMRVNLVGPAGRACGLPVDVRTSHPVEPFGSSLLPSRKPFKDGDVMSRAAIRYAETMESLRFCRFLLKDLAADWSGDRTDPDVIGAAGWIAGHSLPPDAFGISLTEGWRGEISHCVVTGKNGELRRYKVKDPSFNNWFGLALAVRGNGISDFPLCNKSFNLSYCGHDL